MTSRTLTLYKAYRAYLSPHNAAKVLLSYLTDNHSFTWPQCEIDQAIANIVHMMEGQTHEAV